MPKSLASYALLTAAAASLPSALLAQASAPPQPTRAAVTANLQARFKAIDSNSDGSISKAEIDAANARAAQQAAADMSRRLEGQFAKLDTNKDQQLSLAEFKAGAPSPTAVPADSTLQRMDSNKDQKISFDEFGGQMLAAFDRFDTNKDGTISGAEQQAATRQTR